MKIPHWKTPGPFKWLIYLIPLFFLVYSCKKDLINTNSSVRLSFSTDTVYFDTVFTSIGSTTYYLTVHNNEKQKVKLSSIRLAGGNASFYRLNIDGEATLNATDVEIGASDSLYILIRVTIDPNNQNNPFVVADSILFDLNGNEQKVQLVSWGQNAHYILADTYVPGYPKYKIIAHENEVTHWTADKPYVIYGFAVVDSTGRLEIDRGVSVHFHDKSGLWVYKGGSIKVNGTVDAPVFFQGDRLDAFYKDLPGQWDRIWINEGSVNNEINYAVIRNGFIGLQLETLQEQMGNECILSNTRIENMSGFGIFTRYYNITAYNDVVVNCGQYLAAFTLGGNYDVRQCTFGNLWSEAVRTTPSLVLNNYYSDTNNVAYPFPLQAYFGNNIIWGRNDDELLVDSNDGDTFDYLFDHCLLQTTYDISDPAHYNTCLKNKDPLFVDYINDNYELDSLSPAIDYGSKEVLSTSVFDLSRDILEVNRSAFAGFGSL